MFNDEFAEIPIDELLEIPIDELLEEYEVIDSDEEVELLLEDYDVINGDVVSPSTAETVEVLARNDAVDSILEDYDVIEPGDEVDSIPEPGDEVDSILEDYDVIEPGDEVDDWTSDTFEEAFANVVNQTYTRWSAPHLAPVPRGAPAVNQQLVPVEELSVTPVRVPSDELGLTEATMVDFMALYPGN